MGTYKGDLYVPSLDEDYGDKVDNTITTVAKIARGDDALGNGVQIKGDYTNPVDGDMYTDYLGRLFMRCNGVWKQQNFVFGAPLKKLFDIAKNVAGCTISIGV